MKEKALHTFCEEARLRGKVPSRTAICDDDRKEFFRGKDLLRYCEAHPEKLEGLADTSAPLPCLYPSAVHPTQPQQVDCSAGGNSSAHVPLRQACVCDADRSPDLQRSLWTGR